MSWGTYCYVVMPFGLKNADATYQRTMMAIFHDMVHIDMEVYVDDILVKSRTRSEHPQALARILQPSREHNLKMNPKKCVFGVSSSKLLGFIVSKRGIEIDLNKIKAIAEMPSPKNLKELRRLRQNLFHHTMGNVLLCGHAFWIKECRRHLSTRHDGNIS